MYACTEAIPVLRGVFQCSNSSAKRRSQAGKTSLKEHGFGVCQMSGWFHSLTLNKTTGVHTQEFVIPRARSFAEPA